MNTDYTDGFDENGVRVSMSGSLWKMQKGMFSGNIWKRRWVSCDFVHLIVWNLPTRTEDNAQPKYKFKLSNCQVETDIDTTDDVGRGNVFQVSDNKTKTKVILATDTGALLNDWMQFMKNGKEYDDLVRDVQKERRDAAKRLSIRQAELRAEMEEYTDDNDEDDDDEDDDEDFPRARPNAARGIGFKKKSREVEATLGQSIVDYFREHDISSSHTHPVIAIESILPLMRKLDDNISSRVVDFITRDTQCDTCISLADFLEWYGHYQSNSSRHLQQGEVPMNKNVDRDETYEEKKKLNKFDLHLLSAKNYGQRRKFHFMSYAAAGDTASLGMGLIDPELRCPSGLKKVTNKDLVETLIPDIHRLVMLESENLIDFEEDEENVVSLEWNDTYQHLSDDANSVYVHPNKFSETQSEDLKSNLIQCQQNITACLNAAAFQADFLKVAVEGAKIIIDEYSLPDAYKTVQSIDKRTEKRNKQAKDLEGADYQHNNTNDDDDDDDDEQSTQYSVGSDTDSGSNSDEDSYDSYNDDDNQTTPDKKSVISDLTGYSPNRGEGGETSTVHSKASLSFHGGARKRAQPSNDDTDFDGAKLEMGQDEMFSYKGLLFRINAHGVHEEDDMNPKEERVQELTAYDEVLHKTAGNEHRGLLYMKQASDKTYRDQLHAYVHDHEDVDLSDAIDDLIRMRSLLETVVDYDGYRVCVTCPVDVDEEKTLVYGFSSDMSPQFLSDDLTVDTKVADSDNDRVFINACGPIRGQIPRLAMHLNIHPVSRECMGSTSTLHDQHEGYGNSNIEKMNVETLSKWLEIHRDDRNHIYLMNFDGLMLPDMPRSETHDIELRRLRPEFILHYQQQLSPDSYADSEHYIPVGGDDAYALLDGIETKKRLEQLKKGLDASTHLYTSVLPQLTRAMDTTLVMPLDSSSLTYLFHSYGASMRNMGVVYSLAATAHTKQLICTEAVARTSKVLLSNRLKVISRKGKALSMTTENRGMSSEEDYREHMNHVHTQKRECILTFFNLVFGASKMSDHFWAHLLADAVFQKFGFVLPTSKSSGVSKYKALSIPALFEAMQYHTGVVFHNHCDYDLHEGSNECVFRHDDIINYSLPKAKPLSAAQNKATTSGFVGAVDGLSVPCLMSGMSKEAISLLRLRLSIQLTAVQHCSSLKDAADTSRTFYLLALAFYHIGSYAEAIDIVNNQLDHNPKWTAMGGRLYTLLMCCYFRSKNMSKNLKAAIIAFDAAKAIFSYILGPNHPVHALLMSTLADQYSHIAAFPQAALAQTAAVEISQRVMVDHAHVLTAAYEFKLAQIQMLMMDVGDGDRSDDISVKTSMAHADLALESLTNSMSTYESLRSDGVGVALEIIQCLYALTQLSMSIGRQDDALKYGRKCFDIVLLEYGPRQHKHTHTHGTLHLPNQDLVLLPPCATACLLLLADLLVAQQHFDHGLEVLTLIWNAVRRAPSDYRELGHIYMNIAVRMFAALFAQLPYPTRSLLETIAMEVEEPVYLNHGIDIPGAWAKAQELVFEATWVNEPRAYFTDVVDGLMKSEIDGNKQMEESMDFFVPKKANGKIGTGAGEEAKEVDTAKLNIHALQVAVILRLVRKHRKSQEAAHYRKNNVNM